MDSEGMDDANRKFEFYRRAVRWRTGPDRSHDPPYPPPLFLAVIASFSGITGYSSSMEP